MNVYLIGYRCCGKSSIGKLLAEKLGWTFVDADSLLVAQAGREIAAVVESKGWAYFRQLENACLRKVTSKQQQVVATGGGIVLDTQNVKAMKMSGVVVWLTASPDVIRKRLHNDIGTAHQRPALTDRTASDEIEAVLEERLPLYRAASDMEMDTGLESVQALVKNLVIRLRSFQITPDGPPSMESTASR